MAYSTKLSDALHLLVFIEERQGQDLSSAAIAKSLATNPSSVRQMMGRLKRAGLTIGVVGHAMPRLARGPESITMLDVYRAVEGDKPLLHLDTHTNPECGLGVNVQAAIGEMFGRVQRQSEDAMNEVTLSQIIENYRKRVSDAQEDSLFADRADDDLSADGADACLSADRTDGELSAGPMEEGLSSDEQPALLPSEKRGTSWRA